MVAEIRTVCGAVVIVDEDDHARLCGYKWRLTTKGYAYRSHKGELRMHREIMGLQKRDGLVVDHINGNKLDNRRSNLRVCTVRQNNLNSPVTKRNKSGYKGVHWDKKYGAWRTSIQINRRTKHLGWFQDKELAYELYCLAADMAFGEFARHD